jgi:carboxylesterase type B
VADNIAAFGGDPTRVTIWGESAGSASVCHQMALYDGDNTYNGNALFHGAIMDSGSITRANPVDCPRAQAVYDQVVDVAGCTGSPDTLACLRTVPYDQFLAASNSVPSLISYNSISLSYLPRPDGTVLTDNTDQLVRQGKYAAVPMIVGDQEDEGTLFSLVQSNITNTDKLVTYLNTIFFTEAPRAAVQGLVDNYPYPYVIGGSPFRTGILNELYPGFKRLAAILGDFSFTLSRRIFLQSATTFSPATPAWSYLASYMYGTPLLGTFHGSDLLQIFYGILPTYPSLAIQSYYANFVYNLDPNNYSGGTGTGSHVAANWPQWTNASRTLLNFQLLGSANIMDDFRSAAAQYLDANSGVLRS